MAYDLALADRIRKLLAKHEAVTEKKMFGGVGFLVNGNLCCGVQKRDLIVRIAPDQTASMLRQSGARPFDLTGRPMQGWILVAADAVPEAVALRKWVNRG